MSEVKLINDITTRILTEFSIKLLDRYQLLLVSRTKWNNLQSIYYTGGDSISGLFNQLEKCVQKLFLFFLFQIFLLS